VLPHLCSAVLERGMSSSQIPYSPSPVVTMHPIVALAAHELSAAIQRKEVSCVETMHAYLDHIQQLNGPVNAIVALRESELLLDEAASKDAALARGEHQGWLHGLPQAPKDLVLAKGIVTTFGSPLFRTMVPSVDSICVARMRTAGAVLIGKTNTPEFGLGSHTFNEVYGPTCNPYDLSKSAGGSSGGAAAALAARMLPVADGSDFGGSLRNPAAFCNVYGFRPSHGLVPQGPVLDVFVQQLGTEGPMARSVIDIAQLLTIQAGYDARDPLSLSGTATCFGQPLDADLRGKRIAWVGDWNGYLPLEAGIADLCEASFGALRALGCEVDAALPLFEPARIWRIWLALRHWLVGGQLLKHYREPEQRALLKAEAVLEVEGMLRLRASDIYAASVERSAWYQALLTFFEHYDYLATPAAQVFPFEIETRWPQQIAGRTMDTYHRWMEAVVPWTLAGCPVMSVPVGFNAAGLPMGMQIVGPPRSDMAVLQLAWAYQQEHDWAAARRPAILC